MNRTIPKGKASCKRMIFREKNQIYDKEGRVWLKLTEVEVLAAGSLATKDKHAREGPVGRNS